MRSSMNDLKFTSAGEYMRVATNKILEMIDEQILDPMDVLKSCLDYMSDDDVEDMAEQILEMEVQRMRQAKR